MHTSSALPGTFFSWTHSFKTLLLAALLFGSLAFGQSVAVEGGLAYKETSSETFESGFKVGARVVVPVAGPVGLYVHPFLFDGFGVDVGAWYSFPSGLNDLTGFHAYVGAGLSLIDANFGAALNGALGYDVTSNLELVLVYTHRPLFYPKVSQAFDVSLGLKLKFD